MDTLTVILATTAALSVVGLAFMSGWELGHASGIDKERDLANQRIQGVLKSVNKSRPSRRLTYRKVDPRSVGKKRYLNSRLPGEVVA